MLDPYYKHALNLDQKTRFLSGLGDDAETGLALATALEAATGPLPVVQPEFGGSTLCGDTV